MMIQGLNMHNYNMNTQKKTNIIIDLIEDSVLVSRIFENIEKVTSCCDLGLKSWFPITYLMGIDLSEAIKDNAHIIDQYCKVFETYRDKENSNKDTAVLIYKKFDDLVNDHLKQFPFLGVL